VSNPQTAGTWRRRLQRSWRLQQQKPADSPRVAAQGSGLRRLWLLGIRWPLRTGRLYKSFAARRTLRRCFAAVRPNSPGQRSQHGGLRLLPGCSAYRGGRTASRFDDSETAVAAKHCENVIDGRCWTAIHDRYGLLSLIHVCVVPTDTSHSVYRVLYCNRREGRNEDAAIVPLYRIVREDDRGGSARRTLSIYTYIYIYMYIYIFVHMRILFIKINV